MLGLQIVIAHGGQSVPCMYVLTPMLLCGTGSSRPGPRKQVQHGPEKSLGLGKRMRHIPEYVVR